MKKLFFLLIALAIIAPALMADDAKVMPSGVLRTYLVPSFVFGDKEFNADGEKVDGSKQSYFNLGAAVEYGINDFITGALQWAPGYNIIGNNDANDKASVTGPFELFAGAKIQFVGEKAPVAHEKLRIALAPGVIIPTAFGYDAEEEATNMMSGKDFQVLPAQNAWGIGARAYADYQVNESFFINLYSQFKYFFPVAKENTNVAAYGAASMMGADKVDYGYELTLELEPHFDTMITDGVNLGLGLPVHYVMTPDTKYDDTASEGSATKSLSVNPGVSIFLMNTMIPMEFSCNYDLPLWGENSSANNTITFKVKSYLKF